MHGRQLIQGWAGALTDWAALGSLEADQAPKFQSALIPASSLAKGTPNQDMLERAAPAMLVALAATLSIVQVRVTLPVSRLYLRHFPRQE